MVVHRDQLIKKMRLDLAEMQLLSVGGVALLCFITCGSHSVKFVAFGRIFVLLINHSSCCLNYDFFDSCDYADLYFLLVSRLKRKLDSQKLINNPISKLYASSS